MFIGAKEAGAYLMIDYFLPNFHSSVSAAKLNQADSLLNKVYLFVAVSNFITLI